MQLFGTKGQKFLPCPGTKAQRDKLKILPRDGSGQPKFGTRWAGTAKIRDETRDNTGQSRKGHSKTGKRFSKTENDVPKQDKDVVKLGKDDLKQKVWSLNRMPGHSI